MARRSCLLYSAVLGRNSVAVQSDFSLSGEYTDILPMVFYLSSVSIVCWTRYKIRYCTNTVLVCKLFALQILYCKINVCYRRLILQSVKLDGAERGKCWLYEVSVPREREFIGSVPLVTCLHTVSSQ